MRSYKPIDKIFILGRSGCGKSFLGKSIQSKFSRVVVIDTLREYSGGGFDFVVDTYETFLKALVHLEKEKNFKILFRFSLHAAESERIEIFDQLCAAVYHLGDVCLVIEEVHFYSTPHSLTTWFQNIALTGRHEKIALICTSQRAGLTNKTLLSMSTYVYCGQMIDLNDQKYIANFIGKNARDLSELQDRTFIEYSSADPANPKIVKNDFLKTGLDFEKKSTVNKKARPKTKTGENP